MSTKFYICPVCGQAVPALVGMYEIHMRLGLDSKRKVACSNSLKNVEEHLLVEEKEDESFKYLENEFDNSFIDCSCGHNWEGKYIK